MTYRIACLLGLILLAGCGDDKKVGGGRAKRGNETDAVLRVESDPDLTNQDAGDEVQGLPVAAERKDQEPGEKPKAAARPRVRKVIYHGQLSLIVDDFDAGEKRLREVVATHKAQVEKGEVTGEPGRPRSGKWRLRVPAADFEPFMDAVAGLGEARLRKVDSDDVSDRYYDAEAAAQNLEARERALRKLYEQRQAASTADILSIDREITAVRGEINVYRDRMKRWDNLSAFSTLDLSMQDRKGYVPPASPEFSTRLGRAWAGTLEALLSAGQGLVLAAVVLAPWLAILSLPALLVGLPLRRLRRRRAAARGGDTPAP